ncbi:MAG: glutamate-1-semialdehyde 2,1-aminomutase [Thermoanaerobaculia bacterium]|nr:glutamate-1-semialdehyde 2,1-aminomutase [Thermoanaerobaculia bacterium]
MSAERFARARGVLVGGVSSPARSFRAVGGTPRFASHGEGAWLIEPDGRRLLDFVGGWGAAIAGHAHPRVVERVREAALGGLGFGVPTDIEVALAEEVRRRMPALERLRFTCSGTEAVMAALRLARAATGRELVVTFAGGYHGHADAVLGSGSPGVPRTTSRATLTARFNDPDSVEALFRRHPNQIAAVLVEPVAANMGVVPPDSLATIRAGGNQVPPDSSDSSDSSFLAGLRSVTERHGALLVFDEVVTGFRVARGGAQERYGVTPDLTVLGKIVGGGLPCGALGGPAALLERLAPAGPVFHAGTGAGNPLAMTAGLATLELLDDAAYTRLEALGARLESGLRRALGRRAAVQRVGSMLTVFPGLDAVPDGEAAEQVDREAFARLFHQLLEQGVHLPPSPHEAWFLGLGHGEEEIDFALGAVARTEIACPSFEA